MNILGLCTSHSSSAALLIDGVLVGMIQEERFTKRKNQVALPLRSAQALVDSHLDGDRSKIDQVVFGGRWDSPYWVALDHYSDFSVADYLEEMHEYWRPLFYGEGFDTDAYWKNQIAQGRYLNPGHNLDFSFLDTMKGDEATRHFNDVERARAVHEWLGKDTPCEILDHHKAHGYWALYGAPVPDDLANVLVMSADSFGDTSNWSVSAAQADGTLEVLGYGLDHDVARIYKFVTLILGMKPNEHEYKVMGLASYSRSRPHIAAVEDVLFEAMDFRDGQFVSDRPLKDRYFDLKERL
jgi:carbamoyltransferase